ncbi:MAG: hypothetical protein KVP17_001364 [Porospora cf. gigantea B]|uniref:uncharacterized protein n=1 Tax=Porospora cf. gigantea B TaxID=2853592 RepID=UPI003571CAEC|nr:MAG: hypothetical protein KVP17_001364 [Porospora cf. gigantea B]
MQIFLELARGHQLTAAQLSWEIFRLAVLSPVFGWCLAIAFRSVVFIFSGPPKFQAIWLCIGSYAAFFFGEHYLKLSGPLAVVLYGLNIAHRGYRSMVRDGQKFHHNFLESCTPVAESLIFIIGGAISYRLVVLALEEHALRYILSGVLIYLLLFIIRAIMLFASFPLLDVLVDGLSRPELLILTLGGLRGPIVISLAVRIDDDSGLSQNFREGAVFLTISSVLLILLVNGVSFEVVYNWLNPYPPTAFKCIFFETLMEMVESRFAHTLFGGGQVGDQQASFRLENLSTLRLSVFSAQPDFNRMATPLEHHWVFQQYFQFYGHSELPLLISNAAFSLVPSFKGIVLDKYGEAVVELPEIRDVMASFLASVRNFGLDSIDDEERQRRTSTGHGRLYSIGTMDSGDDSANRGTRIIHSLPSTWNRGRHARMFDAHACQSISPHEVLSTCVSRTGERDAVDIVRLNKERKLEILLLTFSIIRRSYQKAYHSHFLDNYSQDILLKSLALAEEYITVQSIHHREELKLSLHGKRIYPESARVRRMKEKAGVTEDALYPFQVELDSLRTRLHCVKLQQSKLRMQACMNRLPGDLAKDDVSRQCFEDVMLISGFVAAHVHVLETGGHEMELLMQGGLLMSYVAAIDDARDLLELAITVFGDSFHVVMVLNAALLFVEEKMLAISRCSRHGLISPSQEHSLMQKLKTMKSRLLKYDGSLYRFLKLINEDS